MWSHWESELANIVQCYIQKGVGMLVSWPMELETGLTATDTDGIGR